MLPASEKTPRLPEAGATSTWMTPCTCESCGLSKLAMSWRGPGRTGTNVWRSVTVSLPPMSLWAETGSWAWGDWGWCGEEGLMGQPGRREQKVEPFRHSWVQRGSPHPGPGQSLSPKATSTQISSHPHSCLGEKCPCHPGLLPLPPTNTWAKLLHCLPLISIASCCLTRPFPPHMGFLRPRKRQMET